MPGQCRAAPNGQIAESYAADNVEESDPLASGLHCLVGFPFEAGECGVAAEEADYQHQSPVWVGLALGENRHRETDEKAAGDVDDDGS